MAFIYNRIFKKIINREYSETDDSSYDGEKSEYEDSSSEDEYEIPVLPLFEAIERREKLCKIKKYFYQHIGAVDIMSNTCLHIAVSVVPYDLDVIKELVKHGVDINRPNWKKDTPLHSAAENPECDVELIKVLLDNGANLNSKNVFKDTPLNVFVMKCLQESNVERNLEIIKYLLENGANPNARNSAHVTPLLMAIHPPYCHLSSFVGLVKFGADFSVTRSNESLLDKPLVVNSSRSLDLIKLLVQYEPRLVKCRDHRRRTPLHIALFGGASVDIVKELINKGANVNARDEESNTPLHLTTLSSYSVIETLVRYGAEINAKNKYGNTPLLEAINHRLNLINPTAIIAFIELGADLEITDVHHKSALYYALANSSVPIDIVELLLEKGDEVYCVNSKEVFEKYNFTRNKRVASLFLQYYLFSKTFEKHIITDIEPETIISFQKYGPALCNVFSKFRDNCISELHCMKSDYLSDGTDIRFYARRNLGNIRVKYRYSVLLIREVLARIHSNKYPHCVDLLRAGIKRYRLLNYLPLMLVYTTVLNTNKCKQSIILDYYSLKYLARYLNRNTLLSLIEAFSDDLPINKRRKQHTTNYNT